VPLTFGAPGEAAAEARELGLNPGAETRYPRDRSDRHDPKQNGVFEQRSPFFVFADLVQQFYKLRHR
jgi:hypothetical protein